MLADRRKKQVSLGTKEKEPRFVQDALASLYQHRKDSFDRFIESFQEQIRSMVDLSLVTTQKPQQLAMTWVLAMLDSNEWISFLKKRTGLMEEFCAIRFIEKKTTDEVNGLFKTFYGPVALTISSEYLTSFKCKLMQQFFANHILQDALIPSTEQSRKSQQIFGNVSQETCDRARGWNVENNIASFMLELLRSLNAQIDMWIAFFNLTDSSANSVAFPNPDFWTSFI